MNKIKKIDIPLFDLNLPDEYKPEWYKFGIEPYKSHSVLEEGDVMLKKPQNFNSVRGFPALKEKPENPLTIREAESENLIKIKEAEVMADPEEFAWFNADDQSKNIEKIIDNNEDVDIEKIQKIEVPKETFESVHSIRDKLLQKKTKERIADVGAFVVLYKGSNIYIGDEEGVREVCEQIILENEDLEDNDLIVFYRVSLQKFFR